jgi:hypothetical protein
MFKSSRAYTSVHAPLTVAAVIVAVIVGMVVWTEGLHAATYEDPVVLAYLSIRDLDASHGDSRADPCALEDGP